MPPQYPFVGPNVQSIFEYIKFEQEDIHLGSFGFDFLVFFGLPGPSSNFNISFPAPPVDEGNNPVPGIFGVIFECGAACAFPEMSVLVNRLDIIAGPVIKIPPTATRDNFTGYAAIVNPFNNTIKLVKYVHQSASIYGVILATISHTIALGDIVKIREDDVQKYAIYVNGVLNVSVPDTEIDDSNACHGIIMLENP